MSILNLIDKCFKNSGLNKEDLKTYLDLRTEQRNKRKDLGDTEKVRVRMQKQSMEEYRNR